MPVKLWSMRCLCCRERQQRHYGPGSRLILVRSGNVLFGQLVDLRLIRLKLATLVFDLIDSHLQSCDSVMRHNGVVPHCFAQGLDGHGDVCIVFDD